VDYLAPLGEALADLQGELARSCSRRTWRARPLPAFSHAGGRTRRPQA
jgi:hypothetical protein